MGEEASRTVPKSDSAAQSRKRRHFSGTPTSRIHNQPKAPASAPRQILDAHLTPGQQHDMLSFMRLHASRSLCERAIQDAILNTIISASRKKEQDLKEEVRTLRTHVSHIQAQKESLSAAHARGKVALEKERKTYRFKRKTLEMDFEKKKKELEGAVQKASEASGEAMKELQEKLSIQAKQLEKYHEDVKTAQRKEREIRSHLQESERRHKDALMELEMTAQQVKEFKAKIEDLKKKKDVNGKKDAEEDAKRIKAATLKREEEEEKRKEEEEAKKKNATPRRTFRKSSAKNSPKSKTPIKRKSSISALISSKVNLKTEDEAILLLQRAFRSNAARRQFHDMVKKVKLEAVVVKGTGCPEVNGTYIRTGNGRDTSYIKHDNGGTFQVRRLTATRWVIGGVGAIAPNQTSFRFTTSLTTKEIENLRPL